MSTVYIDKFEHIESCIFACFEEVKSSTNNSTIKSVLLKPNFINDLPPEKGATTSLLLLSSIIKSLRKIGIQDIAVAESSIQNTEKVFRNINLIDLQKKEGITLINLDKEDRVYVNSPLGLAINKFSIPKVIEKYDLIINVPKMKTHILTGVTLGMKNFFAFFSKAGRKFAHVTDIDCSIVDMYAYVISKKPVITIMDAIVAMSGNKGPIHGKPVNLGLVLLGCDTVAVDAAAVTVMGNAYNSIQHIALALQNNLGNTPQISNKSGLKIEDIKREFSIPIPSVPLKDKMVRIKNIIFKKLPVWAAPDNCTLCNACVEICPKECVRRNNDQILIDYKNCVSCLCCFEACKYAAMDYKVRFNSLYNILLIFKKLVSK